MGNTFYEGYTEKMLVESGNSEDCIIKDKAALEALCREGAEKAGYVARKTLNKAMKKVGFVL